MGRKFKKGGYMYTYSRFTLLYSRNKYNSVKQLYSNKNWYFFKFLNSFRGLKHPIKRKKYFVSSRKILWDVKRDNGKGPSEHLKGDIMCMLYMIHDTYVCACVCVQRERERKRRLWRNQNTWFLGLSNPKKKCEVLAI